MVEVKKEGVILEATNLPFENQAVLNPACIQDGNTINMFYRAVRNGNHSSIGHCRLDGPLNVVERFNKPVLFPQFDYEQHGTEDPRIVFINETHYLFYTAYDGKNALIAYATSKDFKKWTKKGIISPKIKYNDISEICDHLKSKHGFQFFKDFYTKLKGDDVLLWEKDAFIFPKKINGKFALIHRILPDMQVIYFNKFKDLTSEFWGKYLKHISKYTLLEPKFWFESRNVGGGAPPIETDRGWLLIYHAVENSEKGKVYHTNAALLDIENPLKVIGQLKNPLFSPTENYEVNGDVNNVVFPTGTAQFNDKLYIYYGAADKRIAVASVNLQKLLDELAKNSILKTNN